MIRKKITPKMNRDVSWKVPQFVRYLFVFLCAVICLATFSVIADEAANTEKKEGEVVKKAEEKPETQVESTKNQKTKKKSDTASSDSKEKSAKMKTEVIEGSSDTMDGDEKKGITILIGNAKTVRKNEQNQVIGFLNADKITLIRDPETRQTKEIIAEGNVEIRDDNIFATCEHATMNNLTNIIVLKEKVVVLQNKDRLETKIFTYNRTTGKQTGEGGVKFKVTVTQAAPTETPEESEESSADNKDTAATPDKGDKKETPSETDKGDKEKSEGDKEKSDTEEKTSPEETKKSEKDAESKSEKDKEEKDKETEPAESEETDETEAPEETQ